MREDKVTHEQQERRQRNRAPKIKRLDQIVAGIVPPNDEEGEQSDPWNEHYNSDDLALLDGVRVIEGVENHKYAGDNGTRDCAGAG